VRTPDPHRAFRILGPGAALHPPRPGAREALERQSPLASLLAISVAAPPEKQPDVAGGPHLFAELPRSAFLAAIVIGSGIAAHDRSPVDTRVAGSRRQKDNRLVFR
jgi:hypothetical protein